MQKLDGSFIISGSQFPLLYDEGTKEKFLFFTVNFFILCLYLDLPTYYALFTDYSGG